MADINMTDAVESKDKKVDETGKSEPVVEVEPDLGSQLKKAVAILEKAVSLKESRLTGRVLRMTGLFRKKLEAPILDAFVKEILPNSVELKLSLLSALGQTDEMVVDLSDKSKKEVLVEVEVYCCFVVILHLVDGRRFQDAKDLCQAVVNRIGLFNRRSLDLVAAKVYYYWSWANECCGTMDSIRSPLLHLLRTATLRHDATGQEVVLNLLLRNYLHYNLYDQAEKLRSKTEMPESRSNQQYGRYLYYLGRIRAIQLEYTSAKDALMQAERKAPQFAVGFRIEVCKWTTLVRLLLGEIPERAIFCQKGLVQALMPYFEITQAVRLGDLALFHAAVEKYQKSFEKDKTLNLINRLRRNVIRTGLRRINLSYSRISLADVATKLCLGLTDDAACLVAKAIRDGGIEATLDYDTQCMQSKEIQDVYSTQEPQGAFHSRISFCLDTYNEAVRAMRYTPDAHKKGLESAEDRKERLQQEQELAKHIAEEDEEDF